MVSCDLSIHKTISEEKIRNTFLQIVEKVSVSITTITDFIYTT